MIALIQKTDSFRVISYFTIVGINKSDCFDQVVELNDHAYECKTGNEFRLFAYKIDGKWVSIDGKSLDSKYVNDLLK
jgi:hypothetical protein